MARGKGTISQEILYKLSALGNLSLALRKGGLYNESKIRYIKPSVRYGWEEVRRQLDIISAKERTVKDAFYYLQKKGLIVGEVVNNQLYIHLTSKGEERAGRYQINKLKISRPRQWDKKWRLIIFDVPESQRIKREAFRGKIKELNLFPLQKSVWVCPYPCEKEISLLREFFNLSQEQLRMIEANKIEGDEKIKQWFGLK